jgi:hypothetical protein
MCEHVPDWFGAPVRPESGDIVITDMDEVMIPRITVRDEADAQLLLFALPTYMELRIQQNTVASRKPGADQYALSMEMIEETRRVCALIEAIGDEVSAILDDSNTDTEEESDNDGTD